MSTTRTAAELAELRAEAERRVRNGETRADISRDLAIPPSTLSNWALAGGWRSKDLSAERAGELSRLTREKVAGQPARGAESAADAIRSVRDIRPDAPPERVAIAMTEVLMEQGRIEEADRAARFSHRLIQALDGMDEREARRRGETGSRKPESREKEWTQEDRDDLAFVEKLQARMAEIDVECDQAEAARAEAEARARADWDAIVSSGVCPCCRGALERPGAAPPPWQAIRPLEVEEEEEGRMPESSNDFPSISGAGPASGGGASSSA